MLHKGEGGLFRCVFLHVCVYCLHVKTEAEGAMKEHREAACANKKCCVRKACDCMCVFELFSPASRQRNERGQELIAATFFLSPSIHLYTLHPPALFLLLLHHGRALFNSACFNKQELSNKRLPTIYSCPRNYGQVMRDEHRSN